MRELKFHRDLYQGEQIDAAVKLYEKFGDFTLATEGEHFVVRMEAKSEGRERRLAGELGNYALGLTIQQRGAS